MTIQQNTNSIGENEGMGSYKKLTLCIKAQIWNAKDDESAPN